MLSRIEALSDKHAGIRIDDNVSGGRGLALPFSDASLRPDSITSAPCCTELRPAAEARTNRANGHGLRQIYARDPSFVRHTQEGA